MDEHPGSQRIPLSLNKYLYGNADPVNGIDPSGNMTLGSLGAGMNIQASMQTMAISWVRESVKDHFTRMLLEPIIKSLVPKEFSGTMPGGNLWLNAIVYSLGAPCASSKKCVIKGIPLISHGSDLVFHSLHIGFSLLGFWNTYQDSGITSSLLVTREGRYKGAWYNSYSPCKEGSVGDKLSCDEYPFATTLNGGKENYLENNSVSLMLLPEIESNRQRDILNTFYRENGLRGVVGRPFLSIAVPNKRSFYVDMAGKKHRL